MDEWTSHEYFDAALKAAEENRSWDAYKFWLMGELFHDEESEEIEEQLRVAAQSVPERVVVRTPPRCAFDPVPAMAWMVQTALR